MIRNVAYARLYRSQRMSLPALAAILVGWSGCGQPAYPYKEPQVSAKWNLLGGAELIISSDANGSIRNLKFDPKKNIFEVEHAELTTQASSVLDKYPALMNEYARQQQTYVAIRAAEWQGLNQLVSTVAPVVGQAIAGQQMLSGIRTMRPRLVEEAVMLMASGKVDPEELLKQLPPEVVSEIRAAMKRTFPNPPVNQVAATN